MSSLSNSIEHLSIAILKPYPKNARTHSKKQVRQIADSITRFVFTNPVLIDSENTILAGASSWVKMGATAPMSGNIVG